LPYPRSILCHHCATFKRRNLRNYYTYIPLTNCIPTSLKRLKHDHTQNKHSSDDVFLKFCPYHLGNASELTLLHIRKEIKRVCISWRLLRALAKKVVFFSKSRYYATYTWSRLASVDCRATFLESINKGPPALQNKRLKERRSIPNDSSYPIGCWQDTMVDSRLVVHSAAEASTRDADQVVSPVFGNDKRASWITFKQCVKRSKSATICITSYDVIRCELVKMLTQASILMTVRMSCANHLRMNFDRNLFTVVPSQTFFST
jgi:hypothetical protein